MAYRWHLDYVTDLHGDAMAYYYKQDSNAYAKNGGTSSAVSYIRDDSHLDHIDYVGSPTGTPTAATLRIRSASRLGTGASPGRAIR